MRAKERPTVLLSDGRVRKYSNAGYSSVGGAHAMSKYGS